VTVAASQGRADCLHHLLHKIGPEEAAALYSPLTTGVGVALARRLTSGWVLVSAADFLEGVCPTWANLAFSPGEKVNW